MEKRALLKVFLIHDGKKMAEEVLFL